MSRPALSTQQLTAIFHEYSPEEIVTATRSTEAFANEVYDITDTKGQRYFLKILQKQLSEAITTEAHMQQQLLAAGIQTPGYLEITPGEYVGSHHTTRFVLSKYIPGESPKDVTLTLIESFGTTLARLHDALKGISVPPSSMQWLNPERVTYDLSRYEGSVKQDLQQLVQAGKAIFKRTLPTAIVHGDLWMSNVFAKGGTITTVFDLETAEHTVRLVDMARTFASMKLNSDYSSAEIIAMLLKGYDAAASKPLSPEEHANFDVAITFVAGACGTWHAVHGTRYRDPYIRFGKEALQRSLGSP